MSFTTDRVRSFIVERYATAWSARQISAEAVPDDFDLLTEGVIDSLGILELISALETHFEIEIDLEKIEPEQLTAVGPLSECVARSSRPTT